MIDERARRRPGFAAGVAITLGDGQPWTFRKPVLRLAAVAQDDGSLDYEPRLRYVGVEDAGYERWFEAALSAEDGMPFLVARLNLAAALLGMNYDLSPAECADLLPLVPDDPANAEMWEAIAGVAFGRPPKPTASGSGPSR